MYVQYWMSNRKHVFTWSEYMVVSQTYQFIYASRSFNRSKKQIRSPNIYLVVCGERMIILWGSRIFQRLFLIVLKFHINNFSQLEREERERERERKHEFIKVSQDNIPSGAQYINTNLLQIYIKIKWKNKIKY